MFFSGADVKLAHSRRTAPPGGQPGTLQAEEWSESFSLLINLMFSPKNLIINKTKQEVLNIIVHRNLSVLILPERLPDTPSHHLISVYVQVLNINTHAAATQLMFYLLVMTSLCRHTNKLSREKVWTVTLQSEKRYHVQMLLWEKWRSHIWIVIE